ncbi:hypothetical protein NP493_288g03000 [Ridgeia piscesae]|uniref:Double zinc ribbon and ankyrin repeat-containing protein 1 n=1 Tax=Ridgeia piscesae TaxID=27915 RepID=A0AAD9NWX9_RIDPI|nr:hypothetical protein NP493_288g03000 [Ridgeia piscesae]
MTAGAITVPTIVPLRAPLPGQHKSYIDSSTPVELNSDTPGVTIYYTVNGSRPQPFEPLSYEGKNTYKYREPFKLPAGKRTVKALALSADGMRQSNTVTKVFDVEFVAGDTCSVEDDGLNFVSEVRASHAAKREVKKFASKMVTGEEARAEIDRMNQKEQMMQDMVDIGSDKRRPHPGTRFLNSRLGGASRKAGSDSNLANGLMTDDSSHINRLVRSAKWSPPDTATQAMRLQRETDFLKCIYCFAPRPADPYARFCSECGSPVAAIPQSRLPPPEPGQMGTCVHCKSLVPFNTATCLVCEAPMPPQNQPQASLRLAAKRVCTTCGTGNPPDMHTCLTCDAILPAVLNSPGQGQSYPGARPASVPREDSRLLTCTKCGRVNNPDARFCDWCGAKPTSPSTNVVCGKCHANNQPYARFCASCSTVLTPPPRADARNGFATGLNGQGLSGSAKWLPVSMPTGVTRCEMATQTCGLFYPSERDILRKQKDDEAKLAIEKQMRDRQPLMTAVSPGRGYWRKQMDHICAHLKAHAQNNAEFRALIGEPRMGKILTTAVHEDGYELSLTVNFALRGNNDPFVGQKTGLSHADFLSTYTQGRKASISSFTSHDSLVSGDSTVRSTSRRNKHRTGRRIKKKVVKDTKLSEEDRKLLREVGKQGEGQSEEVQQLIDEGANPNCVNRDNVPVLHVAVRNKHSDVIPVLVQAGASVNKKGPSGGNTALHEAVALGAGGQEVIDTLLSCGANPQLKNNKGESAYDLAVKSGYDSIANSFTTSLGHAALSKMIKPRTTHSIEAF